MGGNKMTINEAMVLIKVVRERIQDLKQVRLSVVVKSRTRKMYGTEQEEEINEPQYDAKAIDKKVTELQNFIFQADAKIKQSNAKTEIDIDVNVGNLLAPLD